MEEYNNIPIELRELNRWVLYRLTWDSGRGKYDKKPFNARTGGFAQSNNPNTWCDFKTALEVVDLYDGVGFMLGDGIFGVDIDGVELSDPVVSEVVNTLNSYAEVSPSGKGIHVICYGSKPQGACRKGNFECYDKGRFFTVTGKRIGDFDTIRDCTESIKPLHDKYLARQEEKTFITTPTHYGGGEPLGDEEVIERASRNERFNRLYYGGSNSGDASRDDMALINMLIFWTGGSAGQIDRLYRGSSLMRDKWDRKQCGSTYGMVTINKCLRTYRGSYYSRNYRS